MTEQEFLLADRIAKIKSMNEQYDLEHNAYISFSGGKDSTVLSHLIDEALPNNQIPRIFINTGIEYKLLVAFVEREREIHASRLLPHKKTSSKSWNNMAILSRARNTVKGSMIGKMGEDIALCRNILDFNLMISDNAL